MEETLLINEIFCSIQGESIFNGLPFIFIRLTGCSLRCSYCDTSYAFQKGQNYTVSQIISKISEYEIPHVLVTGGEPLDQVNCKTLLQKLLKNDYTVLVETSGSHSIKNMPKKVHYIVDIKTPSSKMADQMHPSILEEISFKDNVKFVIGTKKDYDYAKNIILTNNLIEKTIPIITPVYGKIKPETIIKWMLGDKLNVRFHLQMHKYIWHPDCQGV